MRTFCARRIICWILGRAQASLAASLLAEGVLAEIEANPNSLTGRYLSGKIAIPVPTRRREPGREKLVLRGRDANNLHGLDVEIPLGHAGGDHGRFGIGQIDARAPGAVSRRSAGAGADGWRRSIRRVQSLTGVERLNDVVLVDQTPIGRTPRSNPITYIKGFDLMRELFAAQPEAKRLSLDAGAFFVQRAGRPLQYLRGRWHGDGGDAVPGRR